MIINYYEILQVSPNASQEVIEAAYKKLVHIYHPDKGGNHEMMVQLNEAYRVLRDPFLRQRYDEELKKFRSYGAKTTGEDEVSREEFTDFTLWINEQLKRKKSEKSKKNGPRRNYFSTSVDTIFC